MKKSQRLFIWMSVCALISYICGMIVYLDFKIGTGGYLAILIMFPTILFGIIAFILLFVGLSKLDTENKLEVSEEIPIVVMKSTKLFNWLIVCVVLGLVSGIVTVLDLYGLIASGYIVVFGFPLIAIFGFLSLSLFLRWRLRRREEAHVNYEIENEYLDTI